MAPEENETRKACLPADDGWFERARALKNRDRVFSAMADELRRRCDELFEPAAARHLDPDDLDSRWWQSRNGNKQLANVTLDLAFAGMFFQQERYAGHALRILGNLVDHDMVENCGRKGGMTPTGGRSGWTSRLDTAPAVELMGLALNLLRPFATNDRCRSIADCLSRFIDSLAEINGPILDQDPPVLINATVIGKIGEGEGAVALEPWGLCDPESHIKTAKRAAMQYLDEGGHDDGVLVEGPMYGFGVLRHIAVLGAMLAQRGDRGIWESEGWDRVVRAYCSQMLPDGKMNMLNDAYEYCPSVWMLAAARYRKNGLARWLWDRTVEPLTLRRWDPDMPWDWRPAWWNGFVPYAMLFYDPEVAPVSPDEAGLPLRRCFHVRGLLDVRGGWESEDLFVSMTCCPDIRWRNRVHKQHAQADRGHVSLNALGEKFLIDVGYGHEFMQDTPKVLSPGGTGEGHTVPVIDGRPQKQSTLATGFTDVHTEGWAPLGRAEFGSAYPDASVACRTLAVIPDGSGNPLYVVVHDFVSIPGGAGMRSLLFQAGWDANVEILTRQEADIVGPRHGHRCRIIATANCPGIFTSAPQHLYPGLHHQRLCYRWNDSSLNSISVMIPYRRDEAPPRFERTDVNDTRGFAMRVCFRGISDTMIMNVVNSFEGMGYKSDGQFALIREGEPARLVVVDGSMVKRGTEILWEAAGRKTFTGPAAGGAGKVRPEDAGQLR